MIIFGSNIPLGTGVMHPDGKEEHPPWIIGWGVGLSRSDFERIDKSEPSGRDDTPEESQGGENG